MQWYLGKLIDEKEAKDLFSEYTLTYIIVENAVQNKLPSKD